MIATALELVYQAGVNLFACIVGVCLLIPTSHCMDSIGLFSSMHSFLLALRREVI